MAASTQLLMTADGVAVPPGVVPRRVMLRSGVAAHYITAGADGPPVLLLHGGVIGSSGAAGWGPMVARLARRGFRVFAPDFPSFGLTIDAQERYVPGFAGHVRFLADFMDAVCIDRAAIAGNSMGTANAAMFASAHPDRVTHLGMIAGSVGDVCPVTAADFPSPRAAHRAVTPFDGTPRWMRSTMQSVVMDPASISDELVQMRTAAARLQPDAYARHLAACREYEKGSGTSAQRRAVRTKGRLDRLDIPAIALWGMDDVVLPVDLGRAQEDSLPNVQFFYPRRCGHQAQTDQPALVEALLAALFGAGSISASLARRAGVSARRPVLPVVRG